MKTADLGLDKKYKLAFESKSLADWNFGLPWGSLNNASNGEVQAYQAKNVIKGTTAPISIVAKREKAAGLNYTSGMIQTFGKFAFQYGYAEAQIKLPGGNGVWPAFWMLPATKNEDGSFKWPPEGDIMEYVGKEPNVVQFNRFYGDGQNDPIKVPLPKTDSPWHTFGILWEPDRLVYFVDGEERGSHTDNIFQEPMYLLLNVALCANKDSWQGDVTNTKLPVQMDINYVRVYTPIETPKPVEPKPEKPVDPPVDDVAKRLSNVLTGIKNVLSENGF